MCDASSLITDVRRQDAFKGVSFTGYKKTAVLKEFTAAMKEGRVEPACYWSAELVCAGQLADLWDTIIAFAAKYVHSANALIFPYLEIRLSAFKDLVRGGFIGQELEMRNNAPTRRLLAEIVSTICFSRKAHAIETVKIKKQEEFDMLSMSSRLKAPDMSYAARFMKEEDAQELLVAMNELAYHVSMKSRNAMLACYWIEWIIEFESLCRKKKQTCDCARRSIGGVDDKYGKDPIWLVWEILVEQLAERQKPGLTKVMRSLIGLFALRYTTGCKKKRKCLLYFAVSLLTSKVEMGGGLCSHKAEVGATVEKIGAIYHQVKKGEQAPKEDAMTMGVTGGRSSVERSAAKLQIMSRLALTGTQQ